MTGESIEDRRRRQFAREERRARQSVKRTCRERGAPTAGALRLFSERAAEYRAELLDGMSADVSDRQFRQHAAHALPDAAGDAIGSIRPEPDPTLPHAPPSADAAELEDALVTLDAYVILLERGLIRVTPYARMEHASSDPDAPVHGWKGADVRIVESEWPGYSGSSTLVVTEHARYLGGLCEKLFRVARPAIGHRSKYEFYGRIAEAANTWLGQHPDTDRDDLLTVAAHEARAVLEDWLVRTSRREQRDPRPESPERRPGVSRARRLWRSHTT